MGLTSSKKTDTNKYEIEAQVGAEVFAGAVDQAYRKSASRFSVPGFRKGKAPKTVVYKMYGEDMFFEDAVNALYPEAYREAVEESGLEVVAYPDIEILSVGKEGFTFKATVTIKPEVEISGYKGIEAPKAAKTVGDSDISEEIERLRGRNARVLNVEGRAAQDGDVAVIDFEGFVDGESFEGGKAEKYSLKLGSGRFIPGFEEQVVGHGVGEEFMIDITFPEDYHEKLRGKSASFKINIRELKEEQLPELDDEFAKDVSEFDTLDELRASTRTKLQKQFDDSASSAFEKAVLDKVIGLMKADIPEKMIESKMDELAQDHATRLRTQRITLDMYLEYAGQSMEEYHESFRGPALQQVRARLVLEKIAEMENLSPSPEDIDEELKSLAAQYKEDLEKVKTTIPRKGLAVDMAVQRAMDFVRENAIPVEVSPEEAEGQGGK